MKQTTNYKFNKPELTDVPDITQLNQNFDTIDAELKAHDTEIDALSAALEGKADSSHNHTIGQLPLASVEEAKAGSIDTKVMTPAKAKESALAFGMALKSINPITSTANDTPVKWGQLGAGTYYFTQTGCLIDQPNQCGFLVNHNNGSEVFQLFKKQNSGSMYYRSGNASGWGETWTKCTNTADLGAYLPLDGSSPMVGSIRFDSTNSEIFVKQTANSNRLIILGGDAWSSGGAIYVCGKDRDVLPGHVILRASDGSNVNEVKVSPDGSATVNDKNILTTETGLPLAGGTMTGAISRNGNFAVNTADNSYMQICGGKTSQNGGTVAVYGVEHPSMPGAVVLTDNGDTPAQLQLVNAGITHGGKNLVKSVDGTAADAAGNVKMNNVVHLSGNETITGLKTNTQNIYAKKAAPQLVLQNTDIVKGTNPDAAKNTSLIFGSSTGTNSANSMVQIYQMLSVDGTNELLLRVYQNVAESSTSGILRLSVTPDGTRNMTWDNKHVVCVTSWKSGDNWYRKYSDGWIEQGGRITSPSSDTTTNFNTAFASKVYNITFQHAVKGSSGAEWWNCSIAKSWTLTNFNAYLGGSADSYFWYACGY